MRVIITGGGGLIGQKLTASLTADNHEVIILSRNPDRYAFPPGVTGARWDGRTAQGWGHLADGADAIVNLAGEPIAGTGLLPARWTAARKQRIRESRVQAGQAVVEAVRAAANKPRVVIQSSGADFYGNRDDEILTETAVPKVNSFLANVVQDWETATAEVETMGVRRAVIRMSQVLTPEGGSLPITVLPFRLFVGGPLGNGRQWWPWIHIEDAVRAIRFLLENETASGPFNLAAPEPLPNREFAKVIGRVLGRPSFLPVPAFALRLLLGEVADIVLNGRRAVPLKLQELGFQFNYPQLEGALRNLLETKRKA